MAVLEDETGAAPTLAPALEPDDPQAGGLIPTRPGDRAALGLNALQQRFEDMQSLAHVGSWEIDPVSGRAQWSDELCRIFGRPLGHAPTFEEFLSYVHPEDRALVAASRAESQTGVPTAATRYRIVRPDGELRHVYARRHTVTSADGTIVHSHGTIQDTTEVVRADRERQAAQEVFETAFAQAPIGMALVGLDGRWLRVNAALLRILGRSEEELLGITFQDITHPEDLDADLADLQRLVAGEITGTATEKRYLSPTGEPIWVHLSVSLARDSDGVPRNFISQIKEIGERKRAETQLQDAELESRLQRDYAQAIIGAMHEGYALTAGGEIKAVNGALCELTGFSEQELVGAKVPFPFWPPERMDETMSTLRRILADEGGSFAITLMRRDGERFEAEITAKPARDASGRVLGFVNTVRDVSLQRRQQAELERLARTDALTGLANRHVLQDSLAEAGARARRSGGQVALVLMDLDSFKQINDRHGHPVGDAVLVEVARRLGATVRAGEVLARVGGEEFAWLMPDADLEDAITAADRARALISERAFPAAGRLTLSAGVGVITAPEVSDAVYRLADRALYDAKQGGRDRTCALTAIAHD